jgi:Rrf2 family protein
MKLSAEAKYALRAAYDMAYHGSAKIEHIAAREGIPAKFLEQILRRLKAANLVESRRGPKGGYALTRQPQQITVREVITAIEGPCYHDCCYGTDDETLQNCQVTSKCVTAAVWRDLAVKIDGVLETVTLADICDRARRFGIPREGQSQFVYII